MLFGEVGCTLFGSWGGEVAAHRLKQLGLSDAYGAGEVEAVMKKLLVAAVLSLGLLGGPVASVQAQESDQQAQESTSDDDDNGMLGLLGLAGLIGLAGLMGRQRDRYDDRDRTRAMNR